MADTVVEKQPATPSTASIAHESEATISPENQEEEIKPAAESDGYLSGFKLFTIVLGLCLVVLLPSLDTAILATAIPVITSEMHSIADVGWYGSAYLLTGCSLQPLTGKIYTQFSLKYTFLSFLVAFEIGSLICATAKSSAVLIVGRAIAGIGSTGLLTGSLTIMAATIVLEKRAFYLGIISSMYGIATVIGPLLGGVFTQHISWRWCFYINLPCGFLAALVLMIFFHPAKRAVETATVGNKLAELDLLGCALFIPACIMFLLALQWGGSRFAWNSATILGLLVGCIPILIVFVFWQRRRGSSATIPLQILTQRTVLSSSLSVMFQMGSMLCITYYLPMWFQSVKGASPTMSGVMGLPLIIAQLVFAVVSGALVGKLGYYAPFMLAGTMLTAIGTGLMSTFTITSPSRIWLGFQIITGIGRGIMLQMPLVAVQTVLPAEQIPVGTSLTMFFQLLGGSLVVAFAQTTFSARLGPSLLKHAPHVDKSVIIKAGAAAVAGMGESVQRAYNTALMETFFVGVGAACLAFTASLGVEWKSVKSKPGDEREAQHTDA